ncbi:putative Fe-S cluster assembly protein SufT [Pseudomonas borbori]|uniref:Probable FeS assembly SUF system protein SufT n=1 Tax=Pseudomonas borbori TaxID=289003 RepID=A0A1I5QPD5_9PSED|nr:putative Fe-S cluster assembly protein SufT [Pseudomonas borbori]SFP48103.1 probable FeS assembly SUF system protein SufT [Pseudomonas borbori]
MNSEHPNPHIRLSEAARQTLADALARGGGSWLRLKIDPHFAHELLFEPGAEGDIAVEVDGICLLLDPLSAQRAHGLSIDYREGLQGTGLYFANPNRPAQTLPQALRRDCPATLIPHGEPLLLKQGERVLVTQALGGSFTVRTASGQLARIAGEHADALGLEALQTELPAAAGAFDIQQVLETLKTVYDPEIPVNVVDLGLIYQCQAQPLEDGGQRVSIKMSMTAPGCGMGDVLKEEARAKVQALPGVSQVEVELVWEPPWDQSRMSEAARLQLGLL